MPRPNTGALERSLQMMLVGVTLKREADEVQAAPLRLDETDQVVQVDLTGTASAAIEPWVEFEVDFGYVFVWAPSQRDVPYNTPQFTWGFELRSKAPVVVACHVFEWKTDDPDPLVDARITTTGARLRAGAFVPGASPDDDPVPYAGLLHLVFGGFAAPYNTPSDDEATDG